MKLKQNVKAVNRKIVSKVAKVGAHLVRAVGVKQGPSASRLKKARSTELSKANLEKMLTNTYLPNSMAGSIDNYVPDPTLSDNRVKVYHDYTTNHTVVAHRGSASKSDWLENAYYAGGLKIGSNFAHSGEVQKKAEAKYGSSNLTTIGHSKGALHAQEFGQHGDIITLDKPVNIKDALLYKVPKYQTDYRGSKDIVSALRPLQRGEKAIELKRAGDKGSSIKDLPKKVSKSIINLVKNPLGSFKKTGKAVLDEHAIDTLTKRVEK
jgi:hypothetical protein